ncbi:hypothetical protein D9M68_692060 [compost metagenome]
MATDGFARILAATWDYVENTGRNACFMGELGNAQRGQRGFLRRLHDDGATRGQRGADLPGEHQQREVPGQHQANHADGFADYHRHGARPDGSRAVVDLVDQLSVPAQRMDGLGDVDVLAFANGFAAVQAFHHSQFMSVVFEQLGKPQEDRLALTGGAQVPTAVFICLAGTGYGQVDIAGVTGCDVRQQFAGGRIGGGERPARKRIAEATVDERLGGEIHLRGDRRVPLFTQQLSHG